MEGRIFNFSAGPAVLPESVLTTVRDNLLNFAGSGLGIMEMSHRGKEFTGIIRETELNLRKVLNIGENYAVLFCTGGATNQFSMVPMNLLTAGQTADYIISGTWSQKAVEEAKKFGEVRIAGTSEEVNFKHLPKSIALGEDPAYVHFTSNNTIFGTQFLEEPTSNGAPLVCDASSDFLCRRIDVNRYGLIYAGAQKNLGPAGVTIVIVRKDLLARTPKDLPIMMDYNTYASDESMYNTPPTLPIYVVGEVLKWILAQGGIDSVERNNRDKAAILYKHLDESDFYNPYACQCSRSLMNVTFRLTNTDLESKFIKEAEQEGFSGLKGHRSVGGLRASIYNAFPVEGIEKLVEFMKRFEKANG